MTDLARLRSDLLAFSHAIGQPLTDGIVHGDRSVSRAEAEESIEVAQDLCDHVTQRAP